MEDILKQVLESISTSGLEDITPQDVEQLLANESSETSAERIPNEKSSESSIKSIQDEDSSETSGKGIQDGTSESFLERISKEKCSESSMKSIQDGEYSETSRKGIHDRTSSESSGGIIQEERVSGTSGEKNQKNNNQEPDSKVLEGAATTETHCGYPCHPLYMLLAYKLRIWTESRTSEVLRLPEFEGISEGVKDTERNDMFAALTRDICEFHDLLEENQVETSKDVLISILKKLKKRGILALLGLRSTEGTVEMLPPARSCLEKSFKQQNSSKSQLSVGARALSKHCHRDQTTTWWGKSTGSEAAKNTHANMIMNRILDQAIWINIHSLPPSGVLKHPSQLCLRVSQLCPSLGA